MTNMDEIDQKNEDILQVLARDGRISNLQLAERVGLAPSTCLRRVQDLERKGVIKGYRAVVDRQATGSGFLAYVTVGLSDHSKSGQQKFERAMNLFAEVRECHNITGEAEYLLRIETPDLMAFKLFHTEKLGMVPSVSKITSLIVLGSPKDERA